MIRLPLEQPVVVYLDVATEGEAARLREDLGARGFLDGLESMFGIRLAA